MNRLIGFLAVLALLSRSALTAPESPALECHTINQKLTPCLDFIRSNADQPSASCCSAAKAIGDEAKTKADRQAICECLKEGLPSVGEYDKNRIPQVPERCGLSASLPPIGSSTDCSTAIADYVF